MPQRIFDGEAAWGSVKLSALSEVHTEVISIAKGEYFQLIYSWVHSLADANGIFELTNMRSIHGRVAPNVPGLSIGLLREAFASYEKQRLLIVWSDEDERLLGYWTGSEVAGRLPPPSKRAKYRNLKAVVPEQLIKKGTQRLHKGYPLGTEVLGLGLVTGSVLVSVSEKKSPPLSESKYGPGDGSPLRETQEAQFDTAEVHQSTERSDRSPAANAGQSAAIPQEIRDGKFNDGPGRGSHAENSPITKAVATDQARPVSVEENRSRSTTGRQTQSAAILADDLAEQFLMHARDSFKLRHGAEPSPSDKSWNHLAVGMVDTKLREFPLAELIRRWDNFMASTDQWHADKAGDLAWFLGHTNDYIKPKHKNGTAEKPAERKQREQHDAIQEAQRRIAARQVDGAVNGNSGMDADSRRRRGVLGRIE